MQQSDRHTLDTDIRNDRVDVPPQPAPRTGPQLLDPHALRRVGGGAGEPPPAAGADLPKGGW